MYRTAILASLLLSPCLLADPLRDADREALIERLDKLQETADAKVDSRFKVALAAYRSAMANDGATMELYLKCVEKVNFDDQHRKSQDFREWKRKESDRLENPGFRLALRHQLSWLVLTLEAASSKGKFGPLAPRAEASLDSIFSEVEKLKDGANVLREPVSGSVFARAYDLGGLNVERWPMAPLAVTEIFNTLLMPPYRVPGKTEQLRAAWMKRIRFESLIQEHWAGGGGKEGASHSPEYERFMEETYPEMMWQMEEDLFRSGDQQGAATRMLAHLEKYVTHKKAPEWAKSFRKLIDPAKPAPADGAAPAETAGTAK